MPWKTLQGGDVGDKNPPGYWAEWARSADFGKGWHSVGDALGVTAFGINIAEANAGEELLVPHTETAYGGQEEVYVVTSGRVRFVCDGAAVEVAECGLLHATHEVMREATALEDGTMVVCVGGVPA